MRRAPLLAAGLGVLLLAAAPRAGRAAALKVAVVSLRAPPQLTFTGKSASRAMAAEARKDGGFEVLGPEEVERRLGREATLLLVECGEAPRCLAERSRALGVDRVVGGSLTQGEGTYRVTVVQVDARGAILSSFDREVPVASRRLDAEVARATPALLRGEVERLGVLEVTSDPPGADVEIDGAAAGRTPLRREVRPGKHTVRVVRAGFLEQEPAWVDVAAGAVSRQKVRLYRAVPGE